MTDLYREWPLDNATPSTEQPDSLHTKHGLDLLDHAFMYGYSRDEFKSLERSQLATLKMAGFL